MGAVRGDLLSPPGLPTVCGLASGSALFSGRARARRDSRAGPNTTTIITAARHHSPAKSQDCRMESAPTNIGLKNEPDIVLFIACNSIMMNTLPPVLLKPMLTPRPQLG
jgi:hypothetical protein